MRKKVIFIHSTVIGNLIDGSPKIGGITVQLYFWAKAFVEAGWTVYTMSSKDKGIKEGIHFLKYRNWGKLEILYEWFYTFWVFWRYKIDLVMIRGASRSLYPVARLARLFRVKSVFFGASDVNFEPSKQTLPGGSHNLKFYQKGLWLVDFFVTQNDYQRQTLLRNYKRESLVLSNIWDNVACDTTITIIPDVVWVANMRPLKRPEWLIKAAQELPNIRFVMIGGVYPQYEHYYKELEKEIDSIENIEFLGALPFEKTSEIIGKSKLLACTSEYEGFPNTFLQAWSANIPVVSTVDPSGVITKNNLGEVVDSFDDFWLAIKHLLEDKETYVSKRENINQYFKKNHSADNNYQILMEYINC